MRSLEIHVLDVGTADSILIIYRDGFRQHVTLIDSGTRHHSDALIAACWLYANGVIDLLVLTHPDGDHVGGALDLAANVQIKAVLSDDPQIAFSVLGRRLERGEPAIRERAECLREGAEVVRELRRGRQVWTPAPGFRPAPHLLVLGPANRFWAECMVGRVPHHFDLGSLNRLDSEIDLEDDGSPINQSSVVLRLDFLGARFLFPGDAGQAALADVVARWGRGLDNLFWLQLPHHGSRHSLTSDLIRRFRPSWAVVSANSADEHHPHPGIVRALNSVGASVYGTRGKQLSWRSDGYLLPGFRPAQPIVARPLAPTISAILRAAALSDRGAMPRSGLSPSLESGGPLGALSMLPNPR